MSGVFVIKQLILITYFKGGPLICYDQNGKAFLAGIISTTVNNDSSNDIGIYTTINKYYTWIYKTIGTQKTTDYDYTKLCSKTDPFCRE